MENHDAIAGANKSNPAANDAYATMPKPEEIRKLNAPCGPATGGIDEVRKAAKLTIAATALNKTQNPISATPAS